MYIFSGVHLVLVTRNAAQDQKFEVGFAKSMLDLAEYRKTTWLSKRIPWLLLVSFL